MSNESSKPIGAQDQSNLAGGSAGLKPVPRRGGSPLPPGPRLPTAPFDQTVDHRPRVTQVDGSGRFTPVKP